MAKSASRKVSSRKASSRKPRSTSRKMVSRKRSTSRKRSSSRKASSRKPRSTSRKASSSRKRSTSRKSVSRKTASRKPRSTLRKASSSRKRSASRKPRSTSRKSVSRNSRSASRKASVASRSPRPMYDDSELFYTKMSEQIGNVMGKKINNESSAQLLDTYGEMLIKEVLRICNSRLHRMNVEDIKCSDLAEACEYISPLLSTEPRGSVERKDTLYVVRLLKPRMDDAADVRSSVLKCFTYLLRNFFNLLVGNVKSLTYKNVKERFENFSPEINDLVKTISRY